MLLIREVFYCKPGKVRPMVDKFLKMSSLNQKAGMPPMRVLTDFAGERYWTLVAEFEVESMKELEDMMAGKGMGGRMQALNELRRQGAFNPGAQISKPKGDTGKRLTNEERKRMQKQREKELRKRKRESKGG